MKLRKSKPEKNDRKTEKKIKRRKAEIDKGALSPKKDKVNKQKPESKKFTEKPKKNSALRITLFVICGIIILLAISTIVGGYLVTSSETNLPNVYIDDYFVGGMTKEEALQVLKDNNWDKAVSQALSVELPAKISFKIDMCKSGAMFTKEGAVEAAYRYGHSENLLVNLGRYLTNLMKPVDVSVEYQLLDDDYIRSTAQAGVDKFNAATEDEGYEIDDEKGVLRMMKGAGEMKINVDSLCKNISEALLNGEKKLKYTHIDNSLTPPDFESLYKELCTEVADAYYTETFEVVDEVVGCTFDSEAAKKLWNEAEPGSYVEIPMEITQPEVTGEELRSRLFRDRLGHQTTLYTGSSGNRINNIELCASKIDGLILYPGDSFSFNGTVGQRTREAGFLPAGAYSDGQVVESVGGGICQVSSTLYCASMYAQMTTTERLNHYFRVNYLPLGCDATVSWGGPDYKFTNSREYPVKISAYCNSDEKSITVEIWGTDVDGSYVELSTSQWNVYDETHASVLIGVGARTTRNVYDSNGGLINQVKEPSGVYFLHDYEIKWPEEAPPVDSGTDEGGSGEGTAIVIPES